MLFLNRGLPELSYVRLPLGADGQCRMPGFSTQEEGYEVPVFPFLQKFLVDVVLKLLREGTR